MAFLAFCMSLQAIITVAFRLANSFTVSLPIPELAPVTRNTWPCRLVVLLHRPQVRSRHLRSKPMNTTVGKIKNKYHEDNAMVGWCHRSEKKARFVGLGSAHSWWMLSAAQVFQTFIFRIDRSGLTCSFSSRIVWNDIAILTLTLRTLQHVSDSHVMPNVEWYWHGKHTTSGYWLVTIMNPLFYVYIHRPTKMESAHTWNLTPIRQNHARSLWIIFSRYVKGETYFKIDQHYIKHTHTHEKVW